ncbi:MAG: sulfatase [Gemmataceae bacterium]
MSHAKSLLSTRFYGTTDWRWMAFVLGILASTPGSAWAQAKRPNVVVIITDDQRWDTLSIAGNPHLKTPNMDRIGKEGVRFENAFCTTSLCSPSRASMLSGMYAHGHKVRNNFTEYPPTLPSLASVLRTLGYVTGYIGKWHMGEDNDAKRPGFDYWVSHKGQGKYYDTEFNIDGTRKTVPGYYTHVVTDLAIDWLKKQEKGKPFLLMLGHKAPHSFYVPEPKYKNLFDDVKVEYPKSAFQLEGKPDWIKLRQETWHGIYGPLFEFRKRFPDTRPEAVADFERMIRDYWATIKSVDDSVGRILKTLEEQGILDDTIVVFVSDNGLLNGEFGMVDKRTMHEPSIRVPMLVRYPGLTPTNQPRTVDGMVVHIDLAPSLLDLCGADPLPGAHGKSWRKLAQGDKAGWRTSFLYEYDYEKQFPYTPNIRGVRTDRWAYMRYPHGDGTADRHLAELYDIKGDPEQPP